MNKSFFSISPGSTVRADIRLDIHLDIRLDIHLDIRLDIHLDIRLYICKITDVRVELSVQPRISTVKSALWNA